MANTTINGRDKALILAHREAWIEHYLARMANGKPVPTCEGYTETADLLGLHHEQVYLAQKKLREGVLQFKHLLK